LEATERQEKLIRAEAQLSQRWLSDVTSEVTRQMGIVDLAGYSKGSRTEAMIARAEKAAAMEEAQALSQVPFFGQAAAEKAAAGKAAAGKASGQQQAAGSGEQAQPAPAAQHRMRKAWRWLRGRRHPDDGSSAEAAAAAAADAEL
jgi:hypothetical protein